MDTATDAVKKAGHRSPRPGTHDRGEELKSPPAAGAEKAKDLKEADDARTAQRVRATTEAKDLDAEAGRLAAEAEKPGADPQSVGPRTARPPSSP
ncbi:hypothetical protein [Streptomyces venezuelae]|uniref:hypothetical protein n=1 Tax=Streptomyces venezuelae TaxID=54571 RepID=UPI0037A0A39B